MVNGVLRAAVIAGVIAGGAAAGFHWFLTEPAVDRAIEIEQQSEKAEGKPVEEPVVSRGTQRLGLILGFLLYGLAWGLLSGICFYLVRSWLPPWSERTPAIFLVVLLGWSVAIFPFLKYPANPPGVGDPDDRLPPRSLSRVHSPLRYRNGPLLQAPELAAFSERVDLAGPWLRSFSCRRLLCSPRQPRPCEYVFRRRLAVSRPIPDRLDSFLESLGRSFSVCFSS